MAACGSRGVCYERAQAQDPASTRSDGAAAAVADVCRRVDGLPLIELAAARCGLLSPGEIAGMPDTAPPGTRPHANRPARDDRLS